MGNMKVVLLMSLIFVVAGCASPQLRFEKISREVSFAGRKQDAGAVLKLSSLIKTTELFPVNLSRFSDGTIDAVSDALWKIASYLPDDEAHALRLENVFNEKVRRGKHTGVDVERLFNAFTMAGLFAKAAALGRQFSEDSLPEIPEIVSDDTSKSTGWWVYDILEQGKKAKLRLLPIKGLQIFMVVSPGCEFAENAEKAIFMDPNIGPVFREHGVVLMRKFEPVSVGAIKDRLNFNAVYIARKSRDFPTLSLLKISPHFYFLKDGKTRYDFAGWSSEDGGEYAKGKIREGLTALGI